MRSCPTREQQRRFAEQFIALGLTERRLPRENDSGDDESPLPRTQPQKTAAYFCMCIVSYEIYSAFIIY